MSYFVAIGRIAKPKTNAKKKKKGEEEKKETEKTETKNEAAKK